jgi:hypothetical protein
LPLTAKLKPFALLTLGQVEAFDRASADLVALDTRLQAELSDHNCGPPRPLRMISGSALDSDCTILAKIGRTWAPFARHGISAPGPT